MVINACRTVLVRRREGEVSGDLRIYGFEETGCGNVDWVLLAQDRDHWRLLVNTVMNLRVP